MDVHFSSKKQNWATPPELFKKLNEEFQFTRDVCAEEWNAKLPDYWTEEDDCLSKDWEGVLWMNPPYGKELKKFVKKAFEESQKKAKTIVALIPSRTDTSYFHDYILDKSEIRFLRGRVRFHTEDGVGGTAPFPSMIVVWKNNMV
jgi:site-specific DNA-methyltransferase (adenine-specific)